MYLCLDVGNTHLYGGLIQDDQASICFRYPSEKNLTSDGLGIFLSQFLDFHHIATHDIQAISVCSVVPSLNYSINAACVKYLQKTPLFVDHQMPLAITYQIDNPEELGADRIATSYGALQRFPDRDLIVIDFGTATTICVLTAQRDYLGGVIMAGIKTSLLALCNAAEKLQTVPIVTPCEIIGKNTTEHLQIGMYYSQYATVQHLIQAIKKQYCHDEHTTVIATGGMSSLFNHADFIDETVPDLVLYGLHQIISNNPPPEDPVA